jgi:hypothetical protein
MENAPGIQPYVCGIHGSKIVDAIAMKKIATRNTNTAESKKLVSALARFRDSAQ